MDGYLIFTLVFIASAAAPGPDIAALIARTLSVGPRAGVAMLFGVIAGKLLLLTLALLGLALLVQAFSPIFVVIKFAGAAYLIWLGVKTWRRAGRTPIGVAAPARGVLGDVALGFGMAIANPIAILFYVSVTPSVVGADGATLEQMIALGAIVFGAMLAIGCAYIALAGFARRLFVHPHAQRRLDRGAGVALIGAGAVVATR